MGIIQLGYVGFGVRDLVRWEEALCEVIGLSVSERRPDRTTYLRMDEYHHRVVLHPTGEDDLLYAGWQVSGPRDLSELSERLRAAGASPIEGTPDEVEQRKVAALVKFRDPNGHPFELFYGPRSNVGAPIQYGRPLSGFQAGPLGLGHLVLRANDREGSERFYIDVMGMKLSDYGSARNAFFHCNPRHHSLAVVQEATGMERQRTAHLFLEVLTLDDVGTAYDLCLERGFVVERTLGKHSNDHAVSFYFESPSGFLLECGYGARLVDDNSWWVPTYEVMNNWGHHRVRDALAAKIGGNSVPGGGSGQ